MAIYHINCTTIARNSGRSSVAAAAYRAGERLVNEQDGRVHDYTKRDGVVQSEISVPDHAPEWAKNREQLWNRVEEAEKGPKARTCREIEVALPKELTREQQVNLMRDYVKENFTDKGMIADWSIHDTGDGNPHCHILLTTRELDRDGKWKPKSRKEYDLDANGEKIKLPSGEWKSHKVDLNDWNKTESLEQWRENWAKIVNRELERHGHEARIDHRSLKDQGVDRDPQIHEGKARIIQKKELRRGKSVELDRSQKNREIKERNAEAAEAKKLQAELRKRERNVEKLLKRAERIKDKIVVRDEAGADRATATVERHKMSLQTGHDICIKNLARIERETARLRRKIEKVRGNDLPPEKIRNAAIKKALGPEIQKEAAAIEATAAKLRAARAELQRSQEAQKQFKDGLKPLDFAGRGRANDWAERLRAREEELDRRVAEHTQRAAEHKIKVNARLQEPGVRDRVDRIQKRIEAVVRNKDKRLDTLEKQIDALQNDKKKFLDLKRKIEPRLKELGRVEIEIRGPLTADNMRRHIDKLLQDRPAPARPRGRTQARIADDDPTKRGKGLDI